jgi:hypothetical protein
MYIVTWELVITRALSEMRECTLFGPFWYVAVTHNIHLPVRTQPVSEGQRGTPPFRVGRTTLRFTAII